MAGIEPFRDDASADAGDFASVFCTRCGRAELGPRRISTAFWQQGSLVMIRNIPALVCGSCGEEYLADDAALIIDRMRGSGLRAEAAVEHVIVPIFEFAEDPPGEVR